MKPQKSDKPILFGRDPFTHRHATCTRKPKAHVEIIEALHADDHASHFDRPAEEQPLRGEIEAGAMSTL
jgi:hypothetical protein